MNSVLRSLGWLLAAIDSTVSAAAGDPADWPMYNQGVAGWRFNAAEKTLGAENVPRLVEKWRFPAEGSNEVVGVIHATPSVVDGCAYFGTATEAKFYKLSPDGKLLWSYRNPQHLPGESGFLVGFDGDVTDKLKSLLLDNGIVTSALVAGDTVYFADIAGWIYALRRSDGSEQWKVNTRSQEFPGAHPMNWIIGSPILADGKVIFGGGTFEQLVAGTTKYRGSTGRGFVVALDAATGRVAWKYDVGPKPEPLDPPIVISDSWGEHTFFFGPATSSVWSSPSFDAKSGTIYFGTDVNTAPRRPTEENPALHTRDSCAVIAVDAKSGEERWITQINPGDVWVEVMRSYDPETGRYKDLSIGDTPKVLDVMWQDRSVRGVGVGCKNGAFYLLKADDGAILNHTPVYTGPPTYPLDPAPHARTLALPSAIGGLQTGCATDGTKIFTNGIDAIRFTTQETLAGSFVPPTAGRVVALGIDLQNEHWRHERPRIASIGGPAPSIEYHDVGDPIASGIAVANGVAYCTTVASGKLLALDARSGRLLMEIEVGPVWSGPSVSRGRVYVGTGNTLFSPGDYESFFPKRYTGTLYCFGLPEGK